MLTPFYRWIRSSHLNSKAKPETSGPHCGRSYSGSDVGLSCSHNSCCMVRGRLRSHEPAWPVVREEGDPYGGQLSRELTAVFRGNQCGADMDPMSLKGRRSIVWCLIGIDWACNQGKLSVNTGVRGERRRGRVAEGAPLLREYTGNRIEGSNPSVSASILTAYAGSTITYQRCPLRSWFRATTAEWSKRNSTPQYHYCNPTI